MASRFSDVLVTTAARQQGRPATGAHEAPPIVIHGSLLLNVPSTFEFQGQEYETPPVFRVTFDAPLTINGADSDEVRAYLDACQRYYDAARRGEPEPVVPVAPTGWGSRPASLVPYPWEVALAEEFVNFAPGDDLPALVSTRGVLENLDHLNVSGVVFSSGLVAIDNVHDVMQFIDGAILSSGGVFLANKGVQGALVVSYNPAVLDRLATLASTMRAFVVETRIAVRTRRGIDLGNEIVR